jgi:hypothetical protein
MSARSFKIFLAVLGAHIIILSVVWVGFPVPSARIASAFIYEGALPESQEGRHAVSGAVSFDHFEASNFNRWIELRNPIK